MQAPVRDLALHGNRRQRQLLDFGQMAEGRTKALFHLSHRLWRQQTHRAHLTEAE